MGNDDTLQRRPSVLLPKSCEEDNPGSACLNGNENVLRYVPHSSNANDDELLTWSDLYLNGRRLCPIQVRDSIDMIA